MKTKWLTDCFIGEDFKKKTERISKEFRDLFKSNHIEKFLVCYVAQNPDGLTEETKFICNLVLPEMVGNMEIIDILHRHLSIIEEKGAIEKGDTNG